LAGGRAPIAVWFHCSSETEAAKADLFLNERLKTDSSPHVRINETEKDQISIVSEAEAIQDEKSGLQICSSY
jgi:hypothetical protein